MVQRLAVQLSFQDHQYNAISLSPTLPPVGPGRVVPLLILISSSDCAPQHSWLASGNPLKGQLELKTESYTKQGGNRIV